MTVITIIMDKRRISFPPGWYTSAGVLYRLLDLCDKSGLSVETPLFRLGSSLSGQSRGALSKAYDADIYLASANAMSEDGILINIDGNANRVSAIAQGPKKVIFIVGMNKVCPDTDSAMKRARGVAAPINAQRFGLDTPCAKTGSCMDCKSPDTICCQILMTRYSKHPGRIHVILVDEALGF